MPQIKGTFRLAHDVSQNRVHQKLADLVLNRRDGFGSKSGWVAFVFAKPEAAHLIVPNVCKNVPAKRRVVEKFRNIEQRAAGQVQQGQERIAKYVLHPRSKKICPQLL